MSQTATYAEWARVALVVVAFVVNVFAIFDANQVVRHVRGARDETLMIIVRRNLRLEYLRCWEQLLVLAVSVTALFIYSESSNAVTTVIIVMIVLSLTLAGESLWDRRDRNRVRELVTHSKMRSYRSD